MISSSVTHINNTPGKVVTVQMNPTLDVMYAGELFHPKWGSNTMMLGPVQGLIVDLVRELRYTEQQKILILDLCENMSVVNRCADYMTRSADAAKRFLKEYIKQTLVSWMKNPSSNSLSFLTSNTNEIPILTNLTILENNRKLRPCLQHVQLRLPGMSAQHVMVNYYTAFTIKTTLVPMGVSRGIQACFMLMVKKEAVNRVRLRLFFEQAQDSDDFVLYVDKFFFEERQTQSLHAFYTSVQRECFDKEVPIAVVENLYDHLFINPLQPAIEFPSVAEVSRHQDTVLTNLKRQLRLSTNAHLIV